MLVLMSALFLAAADSPPPPQAAPAKPKMRCERIEESGSRLGGKRVCMTEDQWKQRTRDDRDALDARVRGVHVEPGG